MRRLVRRFALPRKTLRIAVLAVLGVSLAIACGQEVTIPDPVIDPPDGAAADGGTDGATNPDATSRDAGLDAADAADVVCPDVAPDDTVGVYVSPGGVNGVTCGTLAAPCKTLAVGITRAVAVGRTKVYASRGVYVEQVVLVAGIELVGGWDVTSATTWKRACVAPEDAVVIRAPNNKNITVQAIDLGGEARLSLVRVESKLQGQVDGAESLYGVVAVGASTTLVMNQVRVEMANAGPGTNGLKGDAGVDGGPSCPAGPGGAGVAGTQGPGAPAGTFDDDGYAPGEASPGGSAAAGGDGTVGGTGTCVRCGACGLPPLCTWTPDGTESCGKDGASGCGGGPGAPGGPALGGGSNIGVYARAATVTINGGKIKSGDAGNGGTGGVGGAGGAATRGTAGTNGDLCVTSCTAGAIACTEVKTRGIGGAAGGAGGAGGVGGPGGGGGGGSSFATYANAPGLVTTTPSTTLAHGKAGNGGGPDAGAGAKGMAADHIP